MEAIQVGVGAEVIVPALRRHHEGRTPDRATGLNILLVDDEPDFNLLVAEALGDAGHRVTTASNGEEALNLITRELFDVMVCDIRLPKLDGLALARRIRCDPELAGVRLLALTGYCEASDRARSAAAGFDRHLVKPVDSDTLRTLLLGD